MKRWISSKFYISLLLVGSVFPGGAADTNDHEIARELKRLSLEELMNQEVGLVTRRPERLSESASAVQVITGEDIKRSGATTLPEALRLAPNLQVAQASPWQWGISARGFNQPGLLANKLLVMIDGRTVYTPLFAGVFWDAQNTFLPDIDRIEVVSGPGGALWGANAVNGVINVVSRSARDTPGLLLEGGAGSFLENHAAVRYGGSVGSNFFYRVYGQHFDQGHTEFASGVGATNGWGLSQGGFRIDYYPSETDSFTLQGDAYSGRIRIPTPGSTTTDGQNILGRWNRTLSEGSDLTLQFYFDRTWRRIPGQFAEDLKTYDFDFQHRFPLGERHSLLWGGGYRLMLDSVKNSPGLAFLPADRTLQLFSGFVQDEITLVPERLRLTLGTKLEHNDFSGFEYQPSGRIAWTPGNNQTIWGAISRAVRSPSRIDQDFFVPGVIAGGPDFESEKVIAYELGYRVRPAPRVSLSVATFFNAYDELRSVETNGTSITIQNGLEGQSWGVELSGEYRATDWWRLRGGYTWLHTDIWQKPGHVDLNAGMAEGNDPEHQFVLQSMFDLPGNFQLDLVGRYVDTLPAPRVPGYFTFDARLGWQYKNLELSIVGQNLWDHRHPEFGAPTSRQQIPRSVFGKITLRF